MSRDDGFDVADVATGLYDDPKVKALWRALGDRGRMGHALTLHMATVLASWRHGCRVTVQEAVPVWLEPDVELVTALQSARLLDKAGKLPIRSWKGWFEPASERRDKVRGRWTRANERRRQAAAEVAARLQRGYNAGTTTPVRPTVRPTVRPSVRAREAVQGTNERTNGMVPLAELVTPEALAAAGRKQ